MFFAKQQSFSQGQISADISHYLLKCELNIFQLNINDVLCGQCDGVLYVKCQKEEYYQWIGFCVNCGQNHPKKYLKMNKMYIGVIEDLHMMDTEQLNLKLTNFFFEQYQTIGKLLDPEKTSFGSFSNTFPIMAKPIDPCYQELYSSKKKLFENEYNLLICMNWADNVYRKTLSKIPNSQRGIKSMCNKQQKMCQWFGYCELCKEQGHQLFFVSYVQQQFEIAGSTSLRTIDLKQLRVHMQELFMTMINKLISSKIGGQSRELNSQNECLRYQMQELLLNQLKCKQQNDELRQQIDQIAFQKKQYELNMTQEQRLQAVEAEKALTILRPQQVTGNFYDVVIHCESILQLTAGEGWKVEVINQEEYAKKKNDNTVVVSFYGLYNKGKTFLASQLSNKPLPLGYSVSTIGLSALYPKDYQHENGIVFLDTAGTETPICYQKEDQTIVQHLNQFLTENNQQQFKPQEKRRRMYEIKLKDRLLTEHLLQRFILSQSNIVLIIVDQLTKEEQRLIQKVKNLYQKTEIIIIHNFSKLVKLDDVNKYIILDILESFEVKEQLRIFKEVNLQGNYYVEDRMDSHGIPLPQITHVVMAFDESEAGRFHNSFCIHYLKSRILAVTNTRQFDIIREMSNMVKNVIPEIIDIQQEQINKLVITDDNGYITTNLNSTNLKSISFDLLGDLKVFKGGLDPKYSMIINHDNLILDVELCGPFQATPKDREQSSQRILECKKTGFTIFEWHGFNKRLNDQNQYIILRAVKLDINDDHSKVLENNREKGEFRVLIPMNPAVCVISDNKPQLQIFQGTIRLIYILQKNTEEIDFF